MKTLIYQALSYKMQKLLISLLVAILAAIAGCATPVGTYAKDRGNDFADMFKLSGGPKLGIHADVQATDFVHLGLGGGVGYVGGFYGREIDGGMEGDVNLPVVQIASLFSSGQKNSNENHIPAALVIHGHLERMDIEGHFPKDYCGDKCFISPLIAGAWVGKDKQEIKDKPFYRLFDIESGVTIGVVGVRVGFSPGELVDFFLGWTGIDIVSDDTKNRENKSK